MKYKREIVLVDFKDLKIDITERIILGKYRNKISIFDIKMTHIPTEISVTSERYKALHELYCDERLCDRLEDTFSLLKREYRRREDKRLDMDIDEFYDIFNSTLSDYEKNMHLYKEKPDFDTYLWEFILNIVKEKNHIKKSEDFISRDSILKLDSMMKESLKLNNISKECYRIFKNNLKELNLLEDEDIN